MMALLRRPRETKQETPMLDPVTDLGPSMAPARDGRMRNWGGAAEVLVEDRPDPSITDRTQLVRGARRRNVLDDLHSRGTISKRQYVAATRLLDDCSRASGGGLVANLFGARSDGAAGGAGLKQTPAIRWHQEKPKHAHREAGGSRHRVPRKCRMLDYLGSRVERWPSPHQNVAPILFRGVCNGSDNGDDVSPHMAVIRLTKPSDA